jgi:hypothetical protein
MIVEIKPAGLFLVGIPAENQAPLFIDADRMKPLQPTLELFEMIAWRNRQILIGHGIVNHL